MTDAIRRKRRFGPGENALRLGLLSLLAACACTGGTAETSPLSRAQPVANEVDGVIWEAGNWQPHLEAGPPGASWGNHRAVVVVGGEDSHAPAVLVTIPWRRHDRDPASRAVIVVDAESGAALGNALALRVENASGDVVFQPNPGSAVYHVYYMPWQSTGGYYPTVTYPTPSTLRELAASARASGEGMAGGESVSRAQAADRAAASWVGLAPDPEPGWEAWVRTDAGGTLPRARATHIQSVDDFHSFFPMEVSATAEEMAAFMEGALNGWRVVPEHRDRPVRMRRHIPWHWAQQDAASSPPDTFAVSVLRDEAFVWQVAVVSGAEPLEDVTVAFQGFPGTWLASLTCFNCGGVDEKGVAFTKVLDIPAGTVQPLWLGVRVPERQRLGAVRGRVIVTSSNRGSQSVEVALEVQRALAVNHGFDEPELQGRLFWLDSTVGTDPDLIIPPFVPVRVEESSDGPALSILGRRVELGALGLPSQLLSYFTPELTGFATEAEPILARPLELEVRVGERGAGAPGAAPPGAAFPDAAAPAVASGTRPAAIQPERFEPTRYAIRQDHRGSARWVTEAVSDHFQLTVEGRLEFDGMLDYRMTLMARTDVAVEDIALPVALVPDAAEYMLGLGRKGGRRPAAMDWTWAVENHQEGVWLGGVHKGLQWVLRDDNYLRPLNTNFYREQPLLMPPSWFNEGRGGIRILEERAGAGAGAGDGSPANTGTEASTAALAAVTALNYSGPRTLAAGDSLHFNIRFLLTPFKPIDTRTHFDTRFVHQYVPVDSVAAWGGTVVNIHHANEINPYINYPFFALDRQKAYIDGAHDRGIKVKLYNTIRELTYKAHELFALRSLGDEVLNDGAGGGHSWMQEHLQDGYHSAWHAWRVDDAAMLNKGTSRWTNYYVEGLAWLAEHQLIDGLYLDDIAFSRETVQRIVNVLHRHRSEVVIDLHSANQFNVRDGFINSAMLYMEHFPFVSRLWFGEYFEYDLEEDYWLTEVSGLPFGLMGEMLQDGGHPYRGMLYGMTARKYGGSDPRPVWKLINDFGVAESRMLGYWLPDPPVRTGNPRVLATTYLRPDGALLLALGSWAERDESVALQVDWEALGWEAPALRARAFAPSVEGLQAFAEVNLSALHVPVALGLFVVVEPASADVSTAGSGSPSPTNGPVQEHRDLQDLARYMIGSFSSAEQAAQDTAFLDIRLETWPIWEDRNDGIWLYVEQADAEALDTPYRQRVYRLTAGTDGTFLSTIYSLPGDPLRFAGAWRNPEPLGELTPGSLVEREGCTVVLRREPGGDFVGSTVDRSCPSDLRGASYATTEVRVSEGELLSWDRGFDEEGRQVWGSRAGGYLFRKAGSL